MQGIPAGDGEFSGASLPTPQTWIPKDTCAAGKKSSGLWSWCSGCRAVLVVQGTFGRAWKPSSERAPQRGLGKSSHGARQRGQAVAKVCSRLSGCLAGTQAVDCVGVRSDADDTRLQIRASAGAFCPSFSG